MSDNTDLEEGLELSPKYGEDGLIAAMIVDAKDNEPLMLAYMNEEAVEKTIETGFVHFYSRSRQKLWCKGETSGNKLQVKETRIDCDQDAIWIAVEVLGEGYTCHTKRKSCFYRKVEGGKLKWVKE